LIGNARSQGVIPLTRYKTLTSIAHHFDFRFRLMGTIVPSVIISAYHFQQAHTAMNHRLTPLATGKPQTKKDSAVKIVIEYLLPDLSGYSVTHRSSPLKRKELKK
jgi:hypothetical protein